MSKAFNLKELEGRSGVRVDIDGGAMRFAFPAMDGARGSLAGFAPPPHVFTSDRFHAATERLSPSERMFLTDDDSYLAASRAIAALDSWGKDVAAIALDPTLNATGQRDKRAVAAKRALTALGTQFATLKRIESALQVTHASLFAVPAADVAVAVVDVECRDLFRKLNTAEQMHLTTQVGKSENERLLLALLRSPMTPDSRLRPFIDDAWAARVAREKPQAAGDLVLAESANAWARGVVRYIGSRLADQNVNGTRGALPQADLYKLLRDVGGVQLLDFTEQQVDQFERQLAA